jgi:hypothetical protein
MKTILNTLLFAASLLTMACGSSQNSNEVASDTASVFDTTRLDTPLDTTAVQDVKGNSASGAINPTQYQEANGNQAPRTNVGSDTTGKQEHDNNLIKKTEQRQAQ